MPAITPMRTNNPNAAMIPVRIGWRRGHDLRGPPPGGGYPGGYCCCGYPGDGYPGC